MADPAKTDHRRAPRKPIVTFVWFQLIPKTSDVEPASGLLRSCDISEGGLGIVAPAALPVGEQAFFEITTADGNVSAVGTVVHVVELDNGYFRCGVRVDVLPPNDRGLFKRLSSDD